MRGNPPSIALRIFAKDVADLIPPDMRRTDAGSTGGSGTAVLAGAIPLTPDTEALASIDGLRGDVDELMSLSGEIGLTFRDLRFLDASGLGRSGAGLHLEFDVDLPGEMTDVTPTRGDYTAFDMYAFVVDDQLLVTWVSWLAGTSPAVDARNLAEIMSQRAAANHP